MRRVELPAAIAEVFITDQLLARPTPVPDYRREKLAIQDLAKVMADQPAEVLPRLVRLAMEICKADSAGVSVLEPWSNQFRWRGLAGALSVFDGATTPRDFSPCGICLDHEAPILMERPERVYGWIRDAGITVPEVLLVPLFVGGEAPLGTLWVVAPDGHQFDSEHARVLAELASFTGVALRMIQSEERLRKAVEDQETLAREMSHRVKNVFSIADSLIWSTARSTDSKEALAETLSGRIRALGEAHDLVRGGLDGALGLEGVRLDDIVARILRPYGGAVGAAGPEIHVGERAATNLALVFHELATNAAKYGALSRENGSVTIGWKTDASTLIVEWQEAGGPAAFSPAKQGFGSRLVAMAMTRHGGHVDYQWKPHGLVALIRVPLDQITS